jgi:ribosomal protein S18 acetylase RimI-like enzyme
LFSIREFQFPEDYPAVIELWENSGPGVQVRRSDQPEEIAKKIQRDPDLFLIAEAGSRLVGAVMGGFDGRRGMVYHLAVDKEFRSQGLGASLMEELENRLRSKGCIRCYLMVTRNNPSALDFYEQRGWEPMDLFILSKDLI